MLLVVAIFQLVAGAASRDAATLWYLGFVAAAFAGELVREGFVASGSPAAGALLLGCILLAAAALIGFAASYLRLWTDARRLFWIAGAGITGPLVAVIAYEFATRAAVDNLTIVIPVLLALATLIGVTVARRAASFKPATFLLLVPMSSAARAPMCHPRRRSARSERPRITNLPYRCRAYTVRLSVLEELAGLGCLVVTAGEKNCRHAVGIS